MVILKLLFKLFYVCLEYHINSSANQWNYTVGDNHHVPFTNTLHKYTLYKYS